MILVACVEDKFGMAFGRRRVSRDSAVYADLSAEAVGKAIYTDPRSEALFENCSAKPLCSPDFAEKANAGDFCFFEFVSPAQFEHKTERIILYRWNRRYPSDVKFDIELGSWQLKSTSDFPGSSHEKITKEVYILE